MKENGVLQVRRLLANRDASGYVEYVLDTGEPVIDELLHEQGVVDRLVEQRRLNPSGFSGKYAYESAEKFAAAARKVAEDQADRTRMIRRYEDRG